MLKPTSFVNTLAIAVLVALGPLSTDMYLPALPRIVQELESDSGSIQLTLSLFLVGFAFAQIIYGPLSDRYGRKPVLLAGLLLFAFSSVGCALSDNATALVLFRFLQALGGSAGPVLGRAMVRDIHGPKNSGRVLSHIGSMMALAPSVAPIAGGFMSLYWGWQSIFWFLALFGILGALILFYQLGVGLTMPHSLAGALAHYPHIAGSASGLLGFTQMTIAGLAGIVIGHQYDGTPMTMSLMIAVMGLLTILSYLILVQPSEAED